MSTGIDVQASEDHRASLRRGEEPTMTANQCARDGDAAASLGDRLDRIERLLASLIRREAVQDWYDVEEFAGLVGKAPFTVREWARLGRIHAEKRRSGRGAHPAWVVSHPELLRYRQHGLLPLRRSG